MLRAYRMNWVVGNSGVETSRNLQGNRRDGAGGVESLALAGGVDVTGELGLEGVDAGKFALFAEPVEEIDFEGAAVEITGIPDEMRFDLAGIFVEGRQRSEVDGGGIGVAVNGASTGVDAVAGDHLIFEAQVGGGNADGAAAAGAFDHRSVDAIGAAEADGGIADAAVGEEPANEGAADGDDAEIEEGDGDGIGDVEADGGVGCPIGQASDVSLGAFAEGELLAFNQVGGTDLIAENFPEGFGGEIENIARWGEDDVVVGAHGLDQPAL